MLMDGLVQVPPAHSAISSANLTLLSKTLTPAIGDKPRPIGVGESSIALGRSLVASEVTKQLSSKFLLDFGFAAKDGTLKVYHKVRAALGQSNDVALLSIDATNAFGSIYRSAILKAVTKLAPELLPTFYSLYGGSTTAYFYNASGNLEPIDVKRGVFQGDACGPLFFMQGLLLQLEKLRDQYTSSPPSFHSLIIYKMLVPYQIY
jgi:hypothetical protein